MSKPFIHFLHAGAPDKINAYRQGYDYLLHDNVDLVNFSKEEIESILRRGEWIFPADEADIRHLNELGITNCSHVFLPQYIDGNVIDYWKFVPKDANLYSIMQERTGGLMKYMPMTTYGVHEFRKAYEINALPKSPFAVKTTVGSGSRGVRLVDPSRHGMSREYVDYLSQDDVDALCTLANKYDCNICIQGIIPIKTKVNCDFIIRDGRLLGYKWDETPKHQTSTNWDNGYFIRNEYTDKVMKECTKFLTSLGIYNAIMNFEGFSDSVTELYVIEFNWRMSNSNFEHEALGIDFIDCYINRRSFEVPYGRHRFARYWRSILYSDLRHYVDGKSDLQPHRGKLFEGSPEEVLNYIQKNFWDNGSSYYKESFSIVIKKDHQYSYKVDHYTKYVHGNPKTISCYMCEGLLRTFRGKSNILVEVYYE